MNLTEFERRAARIWDEIPEDYRSGVDGLVIKREAQSHPSLDEIYTLGECLTESYPSDWGGPDTTRSMLVLYYGSFQRLSELDPDFDWHYEIWETITHELRHHLEWLASEDALEDVDYAMDENFKRFQGQDYDPFFYRAGEPIARGVWQAERDVFIEVRHRAAHGPGPTVEFDWEGGRYAVTVPSDTGDVTFIQVMEGVDFTEAAPCVVLVRRYGPVHGLLRWIRREPVHIVEAEATARPIGGGEGEAP